MFPLFETLCVIDGEILNAKYHIRRFYYAYEKYYAHLPSYELISGIAIPSEYSAGKVKLRIDYNETTYSAAFSHYKPREIKTLKLIHCDDIDYSLKYADRSKLNSLASLCVPADEVLIVKNGEISDTSFSNIIFLLGDKWITPHSPLLNGTCRQRLIDEGIISPESIRIDDLKLCSKFMLINAMNDFAESRALPISNIIL